MTYRVTPLTWCKLKPAEFLMGSKLQYSRQKEFDTTLAKYQRVQVDGQEEQLKAKA